MPWVVFWVRATSSAPTRRAAAGPRVLLCLMGEEAETLQVGGARAEVIRFAHGLKDVVGGGPLLPVFRYAQSFVARAGNILRGRLVSVMAFLLPGSECPFCIIASSCRTVTW